jgi:sugar O-acyltransferase (sialic acid O-acetyltransferase NeuD family)
VDIVVFGAGDIARLADHYFTSDSEHRVVAFTVDHEYLTRDAFLGRPLVDFTTVSEHFPPSEFGMFVALSYDRMNQSRAAKCGEVRGLGYSLVSYVSSRCTYLSNHRPGANCFILEDNTVQPFVEIGDDVVLWSGNHLGHDVVIEDHCFISSHVVLSGHVRVEQGCFLGVNAAIGPTVRLGQRTLVGAGAVVLADTEPESVYVSNRAVRLPKTSLEIDLP